MSSSISHRSTRSSWRSSMDGTLVSHAGSSLTPSNNEKEAAKSRRSSTWKRVTTLYAPSSRETVAEDDTLDLWDNNDSDFQRQIAIEAAPHVNRSTVTHDDDLTTMPLPDSVSNVLMSNPLLAATNGMTAVSPSGSPALPALRAYPQQILTANDPRPQRPMSASGMCQFSSPSVSAISSDRSSAFTVPSPGLAIDDGSGRKRFSNVQLPGDALEAIKARQTSSPTLQVEADDAQSDQQGRPTVEILQEPWTIWSAERRPSLPEKERLQMEALDELVRSQMRKASDKRLNLQNDEGTAIETSRGYGSSQDLPSGVDTLPKAYSKKASKHEKRPSSLKSGRLGYAIDPWSEMTPFGMIVQRSPHTPTSDREAKRGSMGSRSSRSPLDAAFAVQQTDSNNVPRQQDSRKCDKTKSGSTRDSVEAHAKQRIFNRASVVEHLTYDQARQLGSGANWRASSDVMQPPRRPLRPDDDLLSPRLSSSQSLGHVQDIQPNESSSRQSYSSTSEGYLPQSRSESLGLAQQAPLPTKANSSASNLDRGSYSARSSHINLAKQPDQPLVGNRSTTRRSSSPVKAKPARFAKISKLLRGKNTMGLLKKSQTPEDDEDFTQMAEDPFAHRTVIPYQPLAPLPSTNGNADQRATKLSNPASGRSTSTLTARSPYAQSTDSRQRSYSARKGSEEHGLSSLRNPSTSSLSISNAKRPTFGLHLQPDAAAAFDSIPLPDTPERSHSRASSLRRSFASPSIMETPQMQDKTDLLADNIEGRRVSYIDDPHEVNSALSHDWTATSMPDDLPADIDECDEFVVDGLDVVNLADPLQPSTTTAGGADEVELLADNGEEEGSSAQMHMKAVPSHSPIVLSNVDHITGLSASPMSCSAQKADQSLESYIFPTRAESLADDVRNSWHADAAGEADVKPVVSVSPRTSIIAPHLRRPSSSSSFI